jgi:RNA polymerase sigma-70 factor, ECF subfamily
VKGSRLCLSYLEDDESEEADRSYHHASLVAASWREHMGLAARSIIKDEKKARILRAVMPQRTDALSDEQLMDCLLAGPEEVEAALSALYDRYSRTVFGVGLKLLGGDRSLAEEVVQEVYLKVWRSSHTFDSSRGSFSTWLYRVTRSVALDLYRKRTRRVHPAPDGELHIAATRDSSPSPEESVEDSWLSWRMSRALEGLSATHREVIELAYFQGLSQREISRQTGVPLGTVKTRTASALKRLRAGLAGEDALREARQ